MSSKERTDTEIETNRISCGDTDRDWSGTTANQKTLRGDSPHQKLERCKAEFFPESEREGGLLAPGF